MEGSFLGLVLWFVGLYLLYWIIRLAVRHGIEDADQRRRLRSDR